MMMATATSLMGPIPIIRMIKARATMTSMITARVGTVVTTMKRSYSEPTL